MTTTKNVLSLSPVWRHLSADEQAEAEAYYRQAMHSARVIAVLQAAPKQALQDPSTKKAIIDFGLSLAEPFRRVL